MNSNDTLKKSHKKKKKSSPETLKKSGSGTAKRLLPLNGSGSLNSLRSMSGSPSNYSCRTYKPLTYTTFAENSDDLTEKKSDKQWGFDVSSVRTESELNRVIAQLNRRRLEAVENRDFPAANSAQESIDSLNKKLDEAKQNTIERTHAERIDHLNDLKSQERQNLDNAWKSNFQKHEESAQQLRDELKQTHKKKRNQLEREEFDIFHPSREYLDIDRKMRALTQSKNYEGAQELLKDLKAMEKVERIQWNEKEQRKASLKLSQFEEKVAREDEDLEARIEEDRVVMVQTQTRSYEELEGKFQTLYQIEDTTYNNEKQKLLKRLI